MAAFHGKPRGGGAGEMLHRTEKLRPAIALRPAQVAEVRRLRRLGAEPEQIATALDVATEEVEKALLQKRSPRPETTRGTLNITLAAHRVFLAERVGHEPLWKTVDRIVGRAAATPGREGHVSESARRLNAKAQAKQLTLL